MPDFFIEGQDKQVLVQRLQYLHSLDVLDTLISIDLSANSGRIRAP